MCLGSCVVERCKMRRGAEGKREKEGVATRWFIREGRERERQRYANRGFTFDIESQGARDSKVGTTASNVRHISS